MTGSISGPVRAYYASVGPVLLTHLRGRAVVGVDTDGARRPAEPTPTSVEDLLDAVDHGILEWWVAHDEGSSMAFALHLAPGEGADVATAATVALLVCDALDGGAPCVLTDGAEGLWLVGPAAGEASADRALAALMAARAPELATDDPHDAEGRVLVAPHAAEFGLVPSAYTLVRAPSGIGVVAPLTLDEVAALTAGMPLDMPPGRVADRLASRGDLAAALTTS